MTDAPKMPIPIPIHSIEIAQNLPVSNTGNVLLKFIPLTVDRPRVIEVPVKHSALLDPGQYDVKCFPDIPIAKILYDTKLHHFNIEVLKVSQEAQFSVLVNLTDLGGRPTVATEDA